MANHQHTQYKYRRRAGLARYAWACLPGAAKKTPSPHKNLIIFRIIYFFGEIFRGYSWDILPLVLQILAFRP